MLSAKEFCIELAAETKRR